MEIIIIASLVMGILILHKPVAYLYNKIYIKQQYRNFLSSETFYHAVISSHVKYYNRLGLEDQRKFLFRTYLFKKSKRFHYIEVQESTQMPILVSAVAVQLTFGLDKFMLDYFGDIFILRDDYHYGFYSRPFMGHVDQTGIYLSWDNFIKGLSGQMADCNIGLHEMGHALAYVNFITATEQDKIFTKEFPNFSKIAKPIFTGMQQGNKNLLGDYAATNYHEFWAVAVEMFFETPVRFKHELPDLYEVMTRVLNQDPLNVLKGKLTVLRRSSVNTEKAIFTKRKAIV
ncbi:MAG TPA: zinc-dependent peptidase [Puia sp.]|nr:zinc-dependent peptidase [Puia sp.]